MDPFTVSTGVITVLQATTRLISFCYDVRAVLKNEHWSLTSVTNELKALRNILESLEDRLHQPKSPDQAYRLGTSSSLHSDSFKNALDLCGRELIALEKTLNTVGYKTVQKSKRDALLQAVRWHLNEKDVKECLNHIERCKTSLTLALNLDQAALLQQVHQTIGSTQATVQNTDYKITLISDTLKVNRFNEETEAILQWLSPVDPCENHEAALSAHQEDTNEWFFETPAYQKWRQTMGSFLWLSGFAGAGKTILSSQVIERLSKCVRDTSEAVAFFYCDFARSEYRDARNVVGSLIAQLCHKQAPPKELLEAYRDSLIPGRKRRPSWNVLKDTLLSLSGQHKIFLVVDALDECDETDELFSFIDDLRGKGTGISVLVSSREETHIEDAFGTHPRINLDKQREHVDRDIQSYVDRRLATDLRLKRLPRTVQSEIRSSIFAKSAGMFRWAQCQMDSLVRLRTTSAIRRSLEKLPTTLYQTYESILKRVPKEDIEILRRTLLWTAYSIMPLSLLEVQECIAIEIGSYTYRTIEEARLNDPRDILSLASSLIFVTESGHVKLAHHSVFEFLQSKEIRESPEVSVFAISSSAANEELAKTCLTYCSLDSLASGPVEAQEEWKTRLTQHPLIRHAAKGWTYYAREADQSEDLDAIIYEFFTKKPRIFSRGFKY